MTKRHPLPFEDSFRFIEVNVRIRSDFQDLLRFFKGSYARFHINIPRAEHDFRVIMKPKNSPYRVAIYSPHHEYKVFKTTQGFVLNEKNIELGTEEMVMFDGGQLYPISLSETLNTLDNSEGDPKQFFSFVQIALLRTLAILMPQHYLLHGAAVSWHENALIFAGASGRGKSSLSLALVKHGFKFLSDDVSCLNLSNHQIEPFPRSLNLRRHGLALLQNLLKAENITPGAIDIEAIFPNSIGKTCPLRYLFLLKGFQSKPEIKPIPKRQSLWQTLPLSHTPVSHPAKALLRLAPLFNKIQCYDILVGELDATVALIQQFLEEKHYESSQKNQNA
ncbi:protein containing Signal transduction serine kinase/phosphorylase, HPr(Ser) kinase [Candidatus Thiomargarita nelsonii]|uniref:Protein containing Signal transduction serine kinase/phosphorylase, HPr(Ser) kinase n=1 Tax=Candidatus Thiomargarita nelsonii TaxID=1003181 RepID=A0A176RTG4_9GAMM|nr:protein containing Signal transduction serine kinase/phosphorylase, HPr(Ser) kinase [Candidatus Thiomargarita nelsonii]